MVKQCVPNSSSQIGYKILIVANNKEVCKIESSNCMVIPELESKHEEADTNVFVRALSKIVEFNCLFYLKTNTKSHIIIIDINTAAQCFYHNINKTDTFLKALLAFNRFTGCYSTRSFAENSKSKSLSLLSCNENYIYSFRQVWNIPYSN